MIMQKKEMLDRIHIDTRGNTVFITNAHFNFCYTPASPSMVSEGYRYSGGLQDNFHDDSQEHKELEKYLCEIAEFLIKYCKQY